MLDIRKGGRSYRKHYESLPNPVQYDEVVPGDALDTAHTHALETLCDAFRVARPRQWSVLTQRQAIRRVVGAGRGDMERLKGLLGRLRAAGQAEAMAERIEPFDDLTALAAAELRAALRPATARLDPGRPLLLFADHGFRLTAEGGYSHGGGSALEGLVPVVRFVPRG